MIVRTLPAGALVVPHSAHALLAFQLADHWGNRATPYPTPRADVLAAVLLHDAGWDERYPGVFTVRDGAMNTALLDGAGLGAG